MASLFRISIPLGLAALVLASCAPISEDACRGGDWYGIGLSDGQAGKTLATLSTYGETCGEFGITPDPDRYRAGRLEGLKTYCTPQNAYDVGRVGDRLNAVCPAADMSRMRPAYRHGARYHEIETEIDTLKDSIDDLETRELEILTGKKVSKAEQAELVSIRGRLRDKQFDIWRLERRLRRYDSWPP